jgi:hypothetical protein
MASVVRNPFKVQWRQGHPWPSTADGWRLGCVGRLNVMEKGQDILLRVLASDKWRARRVSVTILGDGEQRRGLEGMAERLGLANVRFAGHGDDIDGFWARHHALVLPSRAEGLPLVLVEAMLAGRVPIVTDVGGNAELIEDGVTGFVAGAPAETCFDEALERAWTRRADWPAIGAAAAAAARKASPGPGGGPRGALAPSRRQRQRRAVPPSPRPRHTRRVGRPALNPGAPSFDRLPLQFRQHWLSRDCGEVPTLLRRGKRRGFAYAPGAKWHTGRRIAIAACSA